MSKSSWACYLLCYKCRLGGTVYIGSLRCFLNFCPHRLWHVTFLFLFDFLSSTCLSPQPENIFINLFRLEPNYTLGFSLEDMSFVLRFILEGECWIDSSEEHWFLLWRIGFIWVLTPSIIPVLGQPMHP